MDQNNNIETMPEQINEAVEEAKVIETPEASETVKVPDTVADAEVTESSAGNEAIIAAAQAEHSEPVASAESAIAVPEPTGIAVKSEKPKKKGYVKMLISAVLACGVVVGGLWAARTFLVPSPEAVIKKAAITTIAKQQKLSETVAEDIPALLPLFDNYSYKDGESKFVLTVDSIEEVPYARMVSAIISGFEISGNSATSAEGNNTSLSANINYDGKSVLGTDFYLSPELITLSIPELTDKTLSLIPATFAQDYPGSVIGRAYPLDEQTLKLTQDSITDIFEQRAAYTPEAIEKTKKDMLAILAGCFENAQYGYDKDSKLYYVDLAGNHVKDAVIELFRYIYLDSVSAPSLEKSLTPLFASEGVENYSQLIDKMIADMQTTVPELPVSIQLNIEKNLIKNANSVCVPTDKSVIKGFTFDVALSDVSNVIRLSANFIDNGEEYHLLMDIATDYKNDTFLTDVDLSVESEKVTVTMPFNISLSAAGDYNFAASIDTTEQDVRSVFGLSADGTAVMDGEKLIYRLDDCSASMGFDQDAPIVLNFSLTGEKAPLSQIPTAPSTHTELLSMNEYELWALAQQSYNNFGNVAKLINGLLEGF